MGSVTIGYDHKIDFTDEVMKRIAFLLSLALSASSISQASLSQYPGDRPIEFLQSLVLGSSNVVVYIPGVYQLVDHNLSEHQHKLGFVFDIETKEKWSQYVDLSIVTNTSESASMRIRELQNSIRNEYQGVKVLDSAVERQQDGLQTAYMNLTYRTDLGKEMVVSAHYYSDSASLIGIEVTQRVKNHNVKTALRTAEKVAMNAIRLSNA